MVFKIKFHNLQFKQLAFIRHIQLILVFSKFNSVILLYFILYREIKLNSAALFQLQV